MTRRKLTALFAVLAIGAGACANTADEGDTEATEAATEAATGDATEAAATEAATDGATEAADGAYEHLAAAQAGDFEGTEVELLGQWVDSEAENFQAALQPFVDATGIDVTYEGITDYETVLATRVDGGNAPDIAQIAQPGTMRTYASEGQLVNLSEWMNTDQLTSDYIESFVELGSYEDDVYGVFYKGDLKSIVWYPVQAFEDNGYEIPTTWDELTALSDQIIADGNGNPWCVSIEHGDATGWVATDWVEDALLRTADPAVYDQWVNHEIPFNAPEVLAAADVVNDVWFTEDYVYGGDDAILSTFVGDTQTPMFNEDGPGCWMHKQAAWIPEFWPEGTEAGVDSKFFYLPGIDEELGDPVLGSGDQMVMFDDRPEVRAVMEYLATAEAAQGWIEAGGFVSPNQSVPLDWYDTYPNDELAEILNGADTFRFDASDTMPAEVGAGTFWNGMIDWVAANGENTEEVFAQVEDSWPAS